MGQLEGGDGEPACRRGNVGREPLTWSDRQKQPPTWDFVVRPLPVVTIKGRPPAAWPRPGGSPNDAGPRQRAIGRLTPVEYELAVRPPACFQGRPETGGVPSGPSQTRTLIFPPRR